MIDSYLAAARATGLSLIFVSLPIVVNAKPKPGSKPPPSKDTAVADAIASKVSTPEKKASIAQVRIWKATDAPDQVLQIRLLSTTKLSEVLAAPKLDMNNYQFLNYTPIPAGPLTAEITMPDKTLSLSTYLAPDGQSTLFVRRVNGNLSAEWIDDTPDPAEGGGCEFNVFNLLPTSGDIQVNVGEIFSGHLPSTRSSVRVRGLKKANYAVVINGTDGNGKNFHWDMQADFRQCRKASLLIYPDLYGRIRPRLSAQ